MDASFKYNVLKHCNYLVRSGFRQLKAKPGMQTGKQARQVILKKPESTVSAASTHPSSDDCHDKRSDINSDTLMRLPLPPLPSYNHFQDFFRFHQEWQQQQRRDSFATFQKNFLFSRKR